jgi:hypothetical protein
VLVPPAALVSLLSPLCAAVLPPGLVATIPLLIVGSILASGCPMVSMVPPTVGVSQVEQPVP